MIPEEHPGMTTTFKELKPHETPPATNIPPGHSTAPSVQSIVVNGVSVVDPQLASIIGNELEMVPASPEDSQAACPTNSEVITPSEARPCSACVAIVHSAFPARMRGSASIEVLAAPSLTKVINVFPEKTSTVNGGSATPRLLAACARNNPPITSIRTMIPEQHPSMATTLKHLEPHKMPPSTNMPPDLTIAPTVQAVVVDCVPIVEPQLATIIGDNAEMVMA
jgi:hypothetical protein